MNKNRILAFLAAISLLASGVVMAEYNPDKVIDTSLPYTTLAETTQSEEAKAYDGEETVGAAFGGAVVDGVKTEDVNGNVMIPLRQVAEGLGYTVTWVAESRAVELTRGAQFITMSIDKDSYAFSRRAPQELGVAPTLVGNLTYVPVNFVTDIIGGFYNTNEYGTAKIVIPNLATVTEVKEDSIVVEDDFLGEVIVFITEESQIVKGLDRRIYGIDDLSVGARIEIEYSPAMAQSLPPQASAVRINILDAMVEVEETEEVADLTFNGEITEIDGELVTISGEKEICLVVSDETQITKGKDRRIYKINDLEVGMKISGTHAEAMTYSLPPQTAALTISIEN